MGKNWKRYPHGSWQKSETRKRWSKKQRIRVEKFILRHWWIFVISRIRGWNFNFKNTKAESYSEVTLWKMIQDRMLYLPSRDHQRHKWRLQKSWIFFKTTRMRRTSSRRSIRLHPGQNARCPSLLKIPKSECPDIWIRPPKYKWPKSWSSMEDPVVLLERNLYGHLLAGLLWERPLEKILLKYGWEKVPNWECFFVKQAKGTILICARVRCQIGWKETRHQSDLENSHERRHHIFTIFIWVAFTENVR